MWAFLFLRGLRIVVLVLLVLLGLSFSFSFSSPFAFLLGEAFLLGLSFRASLLGLPDPAGNTLAFLFGSLLL